MARLFAVLIGLCLFLCKAEATTVVPFVFDGLCETAQTVVYVRCVSNQSAVFPDREGIFTQTRFAVLDVVKGSVGSELTLVLPGGEWQGQKMMVSGVPQFVVGQETVLFLSEPDDHGSPWPVGLGQGCYGVQVSDDGSRHVRMTQKTPSPPGVLSKPAQSKVVGLNEFLGLVRKVNRVSESSGSER